MREAYRSEARIRCTAHSCTTAWGQTTQKGGWTASTSSPPPTRTSAAEDAALGYKSLLEAGRGFRDLKSSGFVRYFGAKIVVIAERAIAESASILGRATVTQSNNNDLGGQTVTEDEPALSDQIGELTSEQAQQAVVNLYDELPDELWLNQSKWDLEDFPVRAEQLEFSSPTSLRPALQEVMGPGNDELKGELAKIVLVEFASLDETSEYVRSAVRAAREPDMIVPLLIIGAVLIVLAVLPTKVKTKNFTVEFGNLQSVAELTKGLSDIMDKLKPGG